MNPKKWLCLALTALMVMTAGCALAKTEPQSKTLEETITWESETLSIVIDRWCYAFRNTDLRFYVAQVKAASPEQLRTAFAGERYSKDKTEATGDIAARHDAVLAINGDYYNYKDKIGLVIRNGELFRDLDGSRDHLLVEKDGSFTGITKAEFDAGHGEEYIARGVQQSFTFGPLLVRGGEIRRIQNPKYAQEYLSNLEQLLEKKAEVVAFYGLRGKDTQNGETFSQHQNLS